MDTVTTQNNQFKTEFEKEWGVFSEYFLILMRKLKAHFNDEFYLFFSQYMEKMKHHLLCRVDEMPCAETFYEAMTSKLKIINALNERKSLCIH